MLNEEKKTTLTLAFVVKYIFTFVLKMLNI